MPETTVITYNHDVAGLVQRWNQFIEEVWKAASNGVSQMSQFDQDRLGSMLDAIDAYQVWVVSQPQLDLPETTPRPITLDDFPDVTSVENEEINDITRMMILGRDELINSQSSRMPSGLIKYDAARSTSYVAKIRNFLATYVAKTTPLDLPASSPDEALAPAPKRGV